ncbi:integral membrane protein [Phlyctema vagabunda]|uniref:Integral membrane protein n=1 Tax=Phlyctema vagabunda TaxID=108571 RepID=A0ABR4P5L6_9HELO
MGWAYAGSKAPLVLGLTTTFWGLALIIVSMRIYTRVFVNKYRGWDDLFIAIAMLFSTGDQGMKIAWCLVGLGQHVSKLDADQLKYVLNITYAIQILYPWSLGLAKISVLAFYLRLFPSDNFRIVCKVAIGVMVCFILSISLTMAFACNPISWGWKLGNVPYCIDKEAVQYAASVLNLVTDLVILCLPMKYLWHLSLNKKKRVMVITLFSLGSMTCIASAVRLSTITKFYASEDPTYAAFPIAIWSAIEINLTLIAASIPSLKPLFSRIFNFDSTEKRTGTTTTGSFGFKNQITPATSNWRSNASSVGQKEGTELLAGARGYSFQTSRPSHQTSRDGHSLRAMSLSEYPPLPIHDLEKSLEPFRRA